MIFPGFIGPSYTGAALVFSGERAINLFQELIQSGPYKGRMALVGTPGLRRFCTLPSAPVRCIWSGDNRVFAVGGPSLWEILPDKRVGSWENGVYGGNFLENIPIGNVGFASTPAQIFANGQQIFVVSGVNGYLVTAGAVTQVVSAVAGAYLDTFFVALPPDSNRFQLSATLDGSQWDALDFASKEGAADRLTTLLADHEQLWLFGRKTTEVWYNAGSADFPLQRIQGAFIEQGCWAPWSVAKLAESIFWLGGDDRGAGIVWRVDGHTPIRISTHAIETDIQKYTTNTDAVGYAYQENGHSFYVLHFPAAGRTWAYDVTTDSWHERLFWDAAHATWKAHPGRYHAFAFGGGTVGQPDFSPSKHLVGDYRSGIIYEQSTQIFDDDGAPKRWLRSSPYITDELDWTYFDSLQLQMQVGGHSGALEAFRQEGGDPQVMLRLSNDGGSTWTNERMASMGKIGEYEARVLWRQLGRSRMRAFEVSGSDPVEIAIAAAVLKIKGEA